MGVRSSNVFDRIVQVGQLAGLAALVLLLVALGRRDQILTDTANGLQDLRAIATELTRAVNTLAITSNGHDRDLQAIRHELELVQARLHSNRKEAS